MTEADEREQWRVADSIIEQAAFVGDGAEDEARRWAGMVKGRVQRRTVTYGEWVDAPAAPEGGGPR